MTVATVLIPTHQHPETLHHAAKSVLEQTVHDLELFIIGDGVGDDTRIVVGELSRIDHRVKFFDFPKGPRMGEAHRHKALQEAKGRFVAYLGDDDCWMPNHLDALGALLDDADFGHTIHVAIDPDGQIVALPADLENPAIRTRMLKELFNCFGITCAGHTMTAYRRLPYGWRTTPPDFPWTDLYMWRQFLDQPWCRAKSAIIPTSINTWTHQRPNLSNRERADELSYWRGQIATPGFRETLWQAVAKSFATKAITHEVELHRRVAEQTALGADLRGLRRALTKLRAKHAATMESVSWRATRPLRYIRSLASKGVVLLRGTPRR
jgi:glycosyltransferase involved in cell wall biosynthesis